MKYLWMALLSFAFYGCADTTDSLGLGMMPGSDQVIVGTKTFDVTTRSILADSVFAKTSTGYLGKFTDPEFGTFEADFLAQLNCTENFQFPTSQMVSDEATFAEIRLYYDSYFGDSLNASHLSVYALNKELETGNKTVHYTNLNPKDYYDETTAPIAQKAYTAVDLSIKDSIRNLSDYYKNVRIPLPKDFGTQIIRLSKTHPEYFKDADSFIKNVFKGIYVKCDYGDGTVLYVNSVHLNIYYQCHYQDSLGNNLKKQDGTDSIYTTSRAFASTKEVIQANRVQNSAKLKEKAAETDYTYIKSPAGIFTEATLPIAEMATTLANDTLNSVKLVFTNYNQIKTSVFSMNAPKYILMVRKKDMYTFFEKNLLSDNITSFLAQHDASVNQYSFTNITKLITSCIDEKKKGILSNSPEDPDWNKVILIPVNVTKDSNNNIITIEQDLKPGYVKLKGGENPNNKIKMDVIYSSFVK